MDFLMGTTHGLLWDPIPCKAGVSGYYAHPLYCVRKDRGGEWGFTFGNGTDDDLTLARGLQATDRSAAIFRVLHKNDMFPAGSAYLPSLRIVTAMDTRRSSKF